jgi:hypothetical protein
VYRRILPYTSTCAKKESRVGKGKGGFVHWYNPTTRTVEDRPTPSTDEEALEMLSSDINSGAFMAEYEKLREDGMSIEQAMIFVGHEFRLKYLSYQPVG